MDYKGLIFISGKGGTGKTTFSLALANHLAQTGKSVLLCELSERSAVPAYLGLHGYTPTYQPQRLPDLDFDHSLVQGMDCLIEYIGSVIRAEGFARKLFEGSIIESLVKVAPGLNDLAILGKLTSHIRGHGPGFHYDHILVDAPSTGNFYSLLDAPRRLGRSVTRGPLTTQSRGIESSLQNSAEVQFLFMTLFEEFSSDELEDTLGQLGEQFRDQMQVVANRYIELSQVHGTDPGWRSFIESALEKVHSQRARVKDLWEDSFYFPLITDSLHDYLGQQGDVLRKL